MTSVQTSVPRPAQAGSTYARARLWLGISCVGSFVLLAAGALAFGVPGALFPTETTTPLTEAGWLAAYVLAAVLIHLPFDILGGYALPKRFGRDHPSGPAFARSIARGALLFACVTLLGLLAVHFGSRAFGAAGAVGAVLGGSIILLAARFPLAAFVAGLRRHDPPQPTEEQPTANTWVIASDDEGFTGGITGVVRARSVLVPGRWTKILSPSQLELSMRRRELAIRSGLWFKGRIASVIFVLSGVAVIAWLGVGDMLGTSAGTVSFSLWYTLWSFAGLLILPTPSRAAVLRVDRSLRAELHGPEQLDTDSHGLKQLDQLADDEPVRRSGIEAIFHPIPGLSRRDAEATSACPALWDVARTSIYLGNASGSLLGRAVHCNCGRPSLWVFLPTV